MDLKYRINGKLSYETCTSKVCPLLCRIDHFVGFRGDRTARVLCLGEAPGETEVRKRLPFVGVSGKRLSSLMERGGFPYGSYYVTNACKCRPENNANPPELSLHECAPIFLAELEIVRPSFILLWGKIAIKAFCIYVSKEGANNAEFYENALLSGGIVKSTGNVWQMDMLGTHFHVVLFPHPSYLCRINDKNLENKIVERIKSIHLMEVNPNEGRP